MYKNLTKDIPASIVVFLVALPLCLGVALASGAPLLSGIISGIIGGVVVGMLSESHVSVSGPAAGLTAVVLSAIHQLGAFDIFLLAVLLAGALQLLAGVLKAGFIVKFVPPSVIKGLLSAIGIIIITKQIPIALGINEVYNLNQTEFTGQNLLSYLSEIIVNISRGSLLITTLSLLTLIYWEKTPLQKISFFPASVLVIILGIAGNEIFKVYFTQLSIAPNQLVKIPKFEGISNLIVRPNFSQIDNIKVWQVAFFIAIIASVESLLNLEAVENIDPQKRKASPNKELVAQGIGNMFSGLVGGIPITSVIVRSSVNINAGAQSKLSSILHGIFLLVSVVFLGSLLNLIPLASLASILLLTGYKLAKVSLFKEMYKNGLNQFIPFIITIVSIVFTDLLVGIIIGMGSNLLFLAKDKWITKEAK